MKSNKKKYVWIVSYCDTGEAPVVTAFNNEKSARRMFEFHVGNHDHTEIDLAPIYHEFITKNHSIEDKECLADDVEIVELNTTELVEKIRRLQKELEEAKEKLRIYEYPQNIDFSECVKLFRSENLYDLAWKYEFIKRYPLTVGDFYNLSSIFRAIDDVDKFCGEIRMLFEREKNIEQEREHISKLEEAISKAKEKLGIQ